MPRSDAADCLTASRRIDGGLPVHLDLDEVEHLDAEHVRLLHFHNHDMGQHTQNGLAGHRFIHEHFPVCMSPESYAVSGKVLDNSLVWCGPMDSAVSSNFMKDKMFRPQTSCAV